MNPPRDGADDLSQGAVITRFLAGSFSRPDTILPMPQAAVTGSVPIGTDLSFNLSRFSVPWSGKVKIGELLFSLPQGMAPATSPVSTRPAFRSTQILYRIRVLHAEHYIS